MQKGVSSALFLSIVFFLVSSPVLSAQTPSLTPSLASSSAKVTVSPTPTPLRPSSAPETGINLNISPIFVNLVTEPGRPVSSQIRVQNNNNIREYLEFGLYKFVPDVNGSQPVISDIPKDDPFPSWVTFEQKQFIVDPGEIKTVKFTIAPPKDAALGYYYAIAVNRIQEKKETSTAAGISAAPAMSVLMEVRSPYAKRELQLLDFKTDRAVYEYLPVNFKIRVKNTGNIHVVPFGDIFIDWGNKKEIGTLRANATHGNILPQTERTYIAQWTDGFIVQQPIAGNDTEDATAPVKYETKWDFQKADKFRIGKYTAHLLLVYDNGERDIPVEATVSFWVIPWKILAVAALIVLLVLAGLRGVIMSIVSSIKKIGRKK